MPQNRAAQSLAAWENPGDHPEIARVVDLAQIRENAHNLSIPLYVTARSEGDVEGRLEVTAES